MYVCTASSLQETLWLFEVMLKVPNSRSVARILKRILRKLPRDMKSGCWRVSGDLPADLPNPDRSVVKSFGAWCVFSCARQSFGTANSISTAGVKRPSCSLLPGNMLVTLRVVKLMNGVLCLKVGWNRQQGGLQLWWLDDWYSSCIESLVAMRSGIFQIFQFWTGFYTAQHHFTIFNIGLSTVDCNDPKSYINLQLTPGVRGSAHGIPHDSWQFDILSCLQGDVISPRWLSSTCTLWASCIQTI